MAAKCCAFAVCGLYKRLGVTPNNINKSEVRIQNECPHALFNRVGSFTIHYFIRLFLSGCVSAEWMRSNAAGVMPFIVSISPFIVSR